MSNSIAAKLAAEQSDSEWEYEYDPTETETFYVTLDLSSATHDTLSRIKRDQPKGTTAATSTTATDTPARTEQAGEGSADIVPEENSSRSRVQILDLYSDNPLISFDGHLYSCTWNRTIGTDLILAGPDVELPFEPAHREAGFQIAALSNIRLVGKTAKLMPKQTPAASANSAMHAGDPDRIAIPLPATASDERRKQAAFLERIAAAKRARGETDEVFISKGKAYMDFLPGARKSRKKGVRPNGKGVGKRSPRKQGGKGVTRHQHDDIDSVSEDSTVASTAAGPSGHVGEEGEDSVDEDEEDELPVVTARVMRHGDTENRSSKHDVEMRDAG